MNIREISVSRLRDYENNPRNNDLAVEKVKYSIERFGFLFPVVVDMNYTNRKAAKEDRDADKQAADEQQEKDTTKRLQDDLASLRVGERVILHDRIKYLGRRFIRDGEIDFDDRQDLIDMHGVYHNALGGNGNLDKLMEEVMELPVK